jgi:cold shock CspA family protein
VKVDFYSTKSGYGFLQDEGTRLYFRGEDFMRLDPSEPMPIKGEKVSVGEVEPRQKGSETAKQVRRVEVPRLKSGTVESFDTEKGWGFIRAENCGDKVFLHRSEIEGEWVPIKGCSVKFYEGFSGNRARACYVSRTPESHHERKK